MPFHPDYLLERRRIRHAFDRAASTYDTHAVLQREVRERMLERLDWIKLEPQSILDAGCGTGYGTVALQERYPEARLLGMDLAVGMLRVAKRRSETEGRRDFAAGQWICGALEQIPYANQSIDLLFSNLTLQWVNDLPTVLAETHRVLRPRGLLTFSTLGPDSLMELRAAWAAVDRHSHVSAFMDMHDIGDLLVTAGFAEPVMDQERITLTYADLVDLVRDLQGIGAGNATAGRHRGLTAPGRWRAMVEGYESFRRDGRLPATYEVIYGHAWIGESRSAGLDEPREEMVPGEVRVPLDRIGRRSRR